MDIEEQSKSLVEDILESSLARVNEELNESAKSERIDIIEERSGGQLYVNTTQTPPEKRSNSSNESDKYSHNSILTCHHPPLISAIDDFLLGRLVLKSWITSNADESYIRQLEDHIKLCIPVDCYSTVAPVSFTETMTSPMDSDLEFASRSRCCLNNENIKVSVHIPLNYSKLTRRHRHCHRTPNSGRSKSVQRPPSQNHLNRVAVIEDRSKHGFGLGIMENNHMNWIYNQFEKDTEKKTKFNTTNPRSSLELNSDIDEIVDTSKYNTINNRLPPRPVKPFQKENDILPAYLRLMIVKIEEHQRWMKMFKEQLNKKEQAILNEFGMKNGQLLYKICSMKICADDIDRELSYLLEDLSTRVILRNTELKNGKVRYIDFDNERTRYVYSRQLRVITEMIETLANSYEVIYERITDL